MPLREGLRMRWMIYLCGGCPPAPAAGQLPLFTRTPPRAKGGFRRMVEGVSTHPQAGGDTIMGRAVDRLATSAPFRQRTRSEGADVARRSTAFLQPALPSQVKARSRQGLTCTVTHPFYSIPASQGQQIGRQAHRAVHPGGYHHHPPSAVEMNLHIPVSPPQCRPCPPPEGGKGLRLN